MNWKSNFALLILNCEYLIFNFELRVLIFAF